MTKEERKEVERGIAQGFFVDRKRYSNPAKNGFYYRCKELRRPYVVILPRRKFATVSMECSLEKYEAIDLLGKQQLRELFKGYDRCCEQRSTTVSWEGVPIELSERLALSLFQIGADFLRRMEQEEKTPQPQNWSDLLTVGSRKDL